MIEAKESRESVEVGQYDGQPVTFERHVYFDAGHDIFPRWRISETVRLTIKGQRIVFPTMAGQGVGYIGPEDDLAELALKGALPFAEAAAKATPRIMEHVRKYAEGVS